MNLKLEAYLFVLGGLYIGHKPLIWFPVAIQICQSSLNFTQTCG